MRRLHIAFTVELGQVREPRAHEAGPDLDALVEHGPDEPSPRSELDARRPIGFTPQEAGQ